MHPMLTIAVKAARRASAIINRGAQDADRLTVTRKRLNDFVTEVDKAAEAAIIDIIRRAFPDHAILAEESGKDAGREGHSDYTWIIDPLDGTTNFIHGFPQYAVSIALKHRDTITQGVVYDTTRNELFVASRGRGAFLNDRRIRVSRRDKLSDALIGTGFPYRDFSGFDEYMAMLRAVIPKVSGVRRAGAAALDLAYVAAGRFDGFWELRLMPWDTAAGWILVTEAGGMVTDLRGGPYQLGSPHILASNGLIHREMADILAVTNPLDTL
jgi:myo-inositol-1(or 4)-monophosphatase